jgi:hypothetical protein
VAVSLAWVREMRRSDLLIFCLSMFLLTVVGATGLALHVDANLKAQGTIVGERFLHGAPFLAPLLYANMGMLGLITLLDPSEEASYFPAGSTLYATAGRSTAFSETG